MKIVDDCFTKENSGDVALSSIKIEYVQDLDNCQSESEHPDRCQILTVETDDGGGGKFIRIKTGEAGWSISDISELDLILNDFKSRFRC